MGGRRRMKKFYIAMMAMLLSGSAIAAPVDQQTAKEKAAAFLKKQAQHAGPRRAAALRNPQLTEAQAFGNELHIFNMADNGGFVIVSGDDRTEEILGYVEGGSFDITPVVPQLQWLSHCIRLRRSTRRNTVLGHQHQQQQFLLTQLKA